MTTEVFPFFSEVGKENTTVHTTFYPPHLPIFLDVNTGIYGIP
ncbi:hypothetical protein ACFLV2_01700 [Chloroflexota bacterium]